MNFLFPTLIIALVFAGNACFPEISTAQNQDREKANNAYIQAAFRNVAEIKDKNLIQLILDDFLIPENNDQIERVEIFDVSNVGFGSQNILIIYPSRNIYVIERPSSEELENEMQSWRLQDQRRDADNSLNADYFYPGDKDSVLSEITSSRDSVSIQDENELAVNALISDILSSLNRNYQDTTISLRFERDQTGFTFQIWDYNDSALVYGERPKIPPDTVLIIETITEIIRDTLFIETEGIGLKSNDLENTSESLGYKDDLIRDNPERKDPFKFNFSLLNAFLDYNPVSENPFDTLYSYHPGFGVEIGYSLEPTIVFFSIGVGGMYHPGNSFETSPETSPFRDPEQTIIRSFNGFNLYGISSNGIDFTSNNRFNFKLLYTLKYGIYYPIVNKFDFEPEPVLSTFVGLDAGLQNPDISFFVRQSLVTRMNIDSILEYGVTLSF